MSFYIDRANGPRTLAFPAWSDVPLWHEDIMCFAHGARHWPARKLTRIYVGKGNCTDFSGTLWSATLDNESCVMNVSRIEVFAGTKLDRVYLCDDVGKWDVYLPNRLPEALDDGDVFELPYTHEAQTPAAWLPKLPFKHRPGTAPANERAAAKADAAAKIDAHVSARVAEIEAAKLKRIAEIDAAIDAMWSGEDQ